ncbi:MAG: hypothetical protein WA137_01540 [Methanothrix sp.]
MKKQTTRGENDQKQMRKRLENSLPWSLSRWLRKVLGRKNVK